MNQTWLATIFFFALFLVILYTALLILSPFLQAIAWAAILAIIVYPIYAWLLQFLKNRASAAAFVITVLITLLILIPAFRLAEFLSEEAVQMVQVVRSAVNEGEGETWKDNPSIESLVGLWDSVEDELSALGIDVKEALIQGAQLSSGFLAAHIKGVAQNVFLFVVNLLIVIFTFFFFIRDGKQFCERIQRVLPMDREHQEQLLTSIVNSVLAVVHGCVVTAMIQGLLAGLAYWALGLPFSVLLAVTTAFAALFPIGGSSIVWVPASIYLMAAQGDYVRGVILLAWGGGIVGTVDNILKPVFIGSRLRIPVLFLFFSIIGGLRLFGVLGLILGPVLFALLAALLDMYLKEYGRA